MPSVCDISFFGSRRKNTDRTLSRGTILRILRIALLARPSPPLSTHFSAPLRVQRLVNGAMMLPGGVRRAAEQSASRLGTASRTSSAETFVNANGRDAAAVRDTDVSMGTHWGSADPYVRAAGVVSARAGVDPSSPRDRGLSLASHFRGPLSDRGEGSENSLSLFSHPLGDAEVRRIPSTSLPFEKLTVSTPSDRRSDVGMAASAGGSWPERPPPPLAHTSRGSTLSAGGSGRESERERRIGRLSVVMSGKPANPDSPHGAQLTPRVALFQLLSKAESIATASSGGELCSISRS